MQEDHQTNGVTLDDLARMVASGFEDVQGQISELKSEVTEIRNTMATKADIANMATKDDIAELKEEIEGLRNSVNNYLKLSDERYLELKHRQDIIA